MNEQERLALQFLSDEITTNETRIFDHITVTFRWLMATLFAANGGAIVALFGDDTLFPGKLDGLGWFAAGLILSLIMGTLSTFLGLRVMFSLNNAKAKLQQGLVTGDTGGLEQAISEVVDKQKMTWKTWAPTYSGAASLACFIFGLVTIAIGIG